MSDNLSLQLYKTMFRIRMVEEKIREYYPEDEMKTPCHLCIGSEAIATGVILALNKRDQVFGSYRNHGIYVAKTGETDKFFAEMYGKDTGIAHGKAGSMHMTNPARGLMVTSAVVGTTIPVALGCAYANKLSGNGWLTVSFFGDGALEEGIFWECINFASLKNLPVLFVCEDNELAIHSKKEHRHSFKNITDIVKKFGLHVAASDTTDVEIIYNLAKKTINLIRSTQKPAFLHLKYYRYLEHVGINTDFQFNYRSEEEFKKWFAKDPIKLQRRKLTRNGISQKSLKQLEQTIIKDIEKSIIKAKKARFPKESELFKSVYA